MGKKKNFGRKWTAQEEEYLATHYGKVPMWVLMRDLKRTESSIVTHACRINPDRRKYADYERDGIFERVKELFDAGKSDKEILEQMRDVFSSAENICQYRRRHGLMGAGKDSRPWSMAEEVFIRQSWRSMSVAAMAERLGRTVGSVDGKIRALGLREEDD